MSGCVHYEMNLKKKQVVIKMYNQLMNKMKMNLLVKVKILLTIVIALQ